MEFKALASSNIGGIHYDVNTQTLTVEFKSGSRYAYHGVPADVVQDFENAGSPGQFFASDIKDTYPYARVG